MRLQSEFVPNLVSAQYCRKVSFKQRFSETLQLFTILPVPGHHIGTSVVTTSKTQRRLNLGTGGRFPLKRLSARCWQHTRVQTESRARARRRWQRWRIDRYLNHVYSTQWTPAGVQDACTVQCYFGPTSSPQAFTVKVHKHA